VAREVVEAYGDDLQAHPVGTGPYTLKEWKRAAKIVLEASPGYRGFDWDFVASEPGWDDALIAAMKGRRMPQIGRVEISIIEEDSRAGSPNRRSLTALPATFRRVFDAGNNLVPEWTNRGVAFKAVGRDITYLLHWDHRWWLWSEDRCGPSSRPQPCREIRVLRKHQAVAAEMPIPQGVVGHDPTYRSINRYDPALANKLLDHFGYRKGKDGYRSLPGGRSCCAWHGQQRFAISTSCGRSR
jgi:ABC-type transport system substrate-binding protein